MYNNLMPGIPTSPVHNLGTGRFLAVTGTFPSRHLPRPVKIDQPENGFALRHRDMTLLIDFNHDVFETQVNVHHLLFLVIFSSFFRTGSAMLPSLFSYVSNSTQS